MNIYNRLKELGYELPEPAPRLGLYQPVRKSGNLLFVSGQGCTENGVPIFTGKVGAEVSLEQGQVAARRCTLNALAALHAYVGDLNRIAGAVKVLGFVASAPGFSRQPAVMNGCSQLLLDVFGEAGGHARSAIGTSELPENIPVEIEFIFELKE